MIRRWAPAALALLLVSCGGGPSSPPTSSPSATGSPGEIHVFAATVTPHDDEADASLALHNGADTTDRLIGVSCTCATAAEIHGADATGDLGPVKGVALPPDEVVTFAPGGPHIVLVGLTAPLVEGDTVTLELTFAHDPPADAVAEVQEAETPSPA
jgi:copper(I)-binding protein